LCDIINNHGSLGHADEWLNPSHLSFLPPDICDFAKFEDFLRLIISKSATENGVFSLNLHISQYEEWLKEHGIDWLQVLDFDKVYFVGRHDKYAQAYSYTIAGKTNAWQQYDDTKRQLPDDVDFYSILEHTSMILKMEHFYEQKLKHHVHREFFYEDFTSDISTTLQCICEDLDVPFQGVPESELKIQRKSYDQTALDEFRTFMKQRLSQV
jgi:LPS sulfotransferase NodH